MYLADKEAKRGGVLKFEHTTNYIHINLAHKRRWAQQEGWVPGDLQLGDASSDAAKVGHHSTDIYTMLLLRMALFHLELQQDHSPPPNRSLLHYPMHIHPSVPSNIPDISQSYSPTSVIGCLCVMKCSCLSPNSP